VDHGKSALILRLTGMDPDRLAEEKRRGLTIDLGFAWTALPSGREVGFVDVPGHERFIRNMLAGVGPVRLVLFVVAADEGWKPQSEEHLEIVDLLGLEGAVVALTKRDLVDAAALDARTKEVAGHLARTRLEGAPIVACSALTGEGLDELRAALDRLLGMARPPEQHGRPRQFIDRIFTIRGSGTVVTGTLTGGPIAIGDEAEILPSSHRARIRGLQTHKRSLQVARPVSRVAVNLAGTAKEELERGDTLTLAGQWRDTAVFEGWLRPVRGLDHPLTGRGAYKVHVGSAERDARIRLIGTRELAPGGQAFARVALSRSVVLDFKDPFVIREAGRRETVAGGEVLDPDPPARSGGSGEQRLRTRRESDRPGLAWLVVAERGAVRAARVPVLSGAPADEAVRRGALRMEGWLVDPAMAASAGSALAEAVASYHRDHPLRPGWEAPQARAFLAGVHRVFAEPSLADAFLSHLQAVGIVGREGPIVKLPDHSVRTTGQEEADRLVESVRRGEPTPPSVKELTASGFGLELIRGVCAEGRLVRISADIVVTPEFLSAAQEAVRAGTGPGGLTVSGFREALGTSRKYALPILEYFDAHGVTRRQGDVRVLRS
jgi:selenocysteine-specific elongation factor